MRGRLADLGAGITWKEERVEGATVSGDFYHGHTITWAMPLATLFSAKDLTFEVDYAAWGAFTDAHSQPTGSADF